MTCILFSLFYSGAKAEGEAEKTEEEEKGPLSSHPFITTHLSLVSIYTECVFDFWMGFLSCRGQSGSVTVEQVDTKQFGEQH